MFAIVKWVLICILVLPVISTGLFFGALWLNTYSFNYRMTVEVEVNGERHSGSSVIAVSVANPGNFIPRALPSADWTGEAVVVDLGPRGRLFAVLQGADMTEGSFLPFKAFPTADGAGAWRSENLKRLQSEQLTAQLETKDMPLLLAFTDIADESSVRIVNPNDLKQTFGAGAKLVSITVETTRDSVTSGNILQLLPWLNLNDGNENHERLYRALESEGYLGTGSVSFWFKR
jgi:hypothetical protein